MDIFFGTDTSPSSGDSSPVIIRKMVVLPEPFGPTSPTFSPGLSWKEVSTKRTCRPYCLLMRERESTRNYPKFTATLRLEPETAVQTEAQDPMLALDAADGAYEARFQPPRRN